MVRFVGFEEVKERIRGKTVAVVGSGPGCLTNKEGFVDSFDLVVRINNYKLVNKRNRPGRKLAGWTGCRTDIHYSFYGTSVRKTSAELSRDGVALCMCKCPDAKFIESAWHEENGRQIGTDFRYIHQNRNSFWFCDTYIPSLDRFLDKFHLLGDHIPTTGFSCILDVMECNPGSVYLTGFDFFTSKIHNVNEHWRPGRRDDPFRHSPEAELEWMKQNRLRFTTDATLDLLLQGPPVP